MEKGNSGTQVPAWFKELPDYEGYFVAAALGKSTDERLASDKAKLAARGDLSMQMESQVRSVIKEFREVRGTGENAKLFEWLTAVTEVASHTALRGVKVERDFSRQDEDGDWTTYVLMILPKAEVARELMSSMDKQERLNNRLHTSPLYDELYEELVK